MKVKYLLTPACLLFLLFSIFYQVHSLNAQDSIQKDNVNVINSSKALEELKDFALDQINKDRKDFGLEPVIQSNNSAAQIQANDILKTGSLSHLTTNGLKPYMLYSLYNGTGYVQQNVAQIRYILPTSDNPENDQTSNNLCETIKKYNSCPILEPFKAIKDLESSMVYNDSKCCNDGHKKNILNKFHTHVSLGIAYDKYNLVIVQNFENQYIGSNYTIQKNNNSIKLQAKFLDHPKYNFAINHISFFLDDHPTTLNYEKNKNKNGYDLGDLKLMVSKPLPSFTKYVQEDDSYKVIEAENWNSTNNSVDMEMNLPDDIPINNKVLTMVVYGKSTENETNNEHEKDKTNDDYIPLTSYTFFSY